MHGSRIVLLIAVTAITAAALHAQTAPTTRPVTNGLSPIRLDDPPVFLTGTTDQRNAAIHKALETEITGFSCTGLPLDAMLSGLAIQVKIDLKTDWPALEKANIRRNTELSLHLHNKTAEQMLLIVLSLVKPATGFVGYRIENGVLAIAPQTGPMNVDRDQEQQWNALITAQLKQSGKVQLDDVALTVALQELGKSFKFDIVLDTPALEKAGLSPDTRISINLPEKTASDILDAILAQAATPKTSLVYRIEHGIVRGTTQPPPDRK